MSLVLPASRRPLRVSFVLPKFVDHPVGGYRVVLDYANALAARGHRVTLVLGVLGTWNRLAPRPPLAQLIESVGQATRSRLGVPWAGLDPRVRVRAVPVVGPGRLPAADVTVATAWQTAASVADAPARCGARLAFIQHDERNWLSDPADRARVEASWRLAMHKGAIAHWLVELLGDAGEGERTTYVPNGIDLSAYRMTTPPGQRDPHSVAMLVHGAAWKGTDVGLAALERVREQVPELAVTLYGASGGYGTLPSWAHFAGSLSQSEVVALFNRSAIFVHPSLTEGWPLPPAEAMACGAAVVCADNPGVLDYARADHNARVVPREDPEALAAAILTLIRDPGARVSLAEAAHREIQAYSVPAATDRFEALLTRLAQGTA